MFKSFARPSREKCFMNFINSLSQAAIGFSQEDMRNAESYIITQLQGHRSRDKYFVTIEG